MLIDTAVHCQFSATSPKQIAHLSRSAAHCHYAVPKRSENCSENSRGQAGINYVHTSKMLLAWQLAALVASCCCCPFWLLLWHRCCGIWIGTLSCMPLNIYRVVTTCKRCYSNTHFAASRSLGCDARQSPRLVLKPQGGKHPFQRGPDSSRLSLLLLQFNDNVKSLGLIFVPAATLRQAMSGRPPSNLR